MQIRDITASDLPEFAVIFRELVDDGETYAYPEGLTDEQIRDLWFEQAPGRTVVAVDDDGALLGSAKMGPNRPGRGSHVGTASFMVGDRWRDVEAGRRAGCRTVFLDRAYAERRPDPPADYTTRDLPAAVDWILSQTRTIG